MVTRNKEWVICFSNANLWVENYNNRNLSFIRWAQQILDDRTNSEHERLIEIVHFGKKQGKRWREMAELKKCMKQHQVHQLCVVES